MTQKRLSGIELLRIISIMMIVAMHIMGYAYHSSNLMNHEMLMLINTIGNSGVTIFILISGYFGIHSTVSKFIKLMAVIWFYSILSYIINIEFLDTEITLQGIESALFPVLSRKYWFMTCYMILFCFSPFLNRMTNALTKKEYQRIIILTGIFFVIAPTLLPFEIMKDGGKGVINVFLAYIIGQYIKAYGFPQIIARRNTLILTASLLIIFIKSTYDTLTIGSTTLSFTRDNNFFIILSAVVILFKFLRYKFSSSFINYLAGFVFPIYLIQDICLKIVAPLLRYNSENNIFMLYMIETMGGIILIALIIESIRRVLLNSLTEKMANYIEKKEILSKF